MSSPLPQISQLLQCLSPLRAYWQDLGQCCYHSHFLQVFCGKIPKDMYEDELIPHFERCGHIWDLRFCWAEKSAKFDIAGECVTLFVSRLMMDPMSGLNRGYAFITFTTREEALEAVKQVPPLCSSANTSTTTILNEILIHSVYDDSYEKFDKYLVHRWS